MKEYKVIVDDNGKQFWFEGGKVVDAPVDWFKILSLGSSFERFTRLSKVLNTLFPLKDGKSDLQFDINHHHKVKEFKIIYPETKYFESYIVTPFESGEIKI